jgi:diaminohydroxyphosphoribosylaminopyrimidine deaminase/5-amino-6-(5-phosphoribosylamino)uracil reductase
MQTEAVNILSSQQLFLRRCFDLAVKGLGACSPNPLVGSLIVSGNSRIIGEGWHQKYGAAHAEVNAVASVKPEDKPLIRQSTLYVSLEPCAHFGKTPPCVDLILREQIPHVVIAYKDPFPEVAGKSIQKLREQGVKVEVFHQNTIQKNSFADRDPLSTGLLWREGGKEGEVHMSLKPFFVNVQLNRPYIILKWAESADGFMGKMHEAIPISNAYSKRLVHKWRSEVDAILVGTNTASLDNPELTTRYYFGKSPLRVVLDKKGRLPKHLKLFDGSVQTLIYTAQRTSLEGEGTGNDPKWIKQENREDIPIEYCPISFDGDLLKNMCADLWRRKIGILLVEGGSQILNHFITQGLWDEARVFKSSETLSLDNSNEVGVEAPILPHQVPNRILTLDDNWLYIFKNP